MISILKSFLYAIEGVIDGGRNERNFKIHIVFAILTVSFAFLLNFSLTKWFILLLTIGIMLALELMNSAVERTVDLITEDYHPLAKQAKDLAAGSVFIFSVIAVIIGILLFAGPLIEYIV
ncbi:diacylglycerol kinase family protein [Pseudalkalibacillus berkeleyi]|uniref:Diacylglycerol kinase family protein n=1 Tax=Pseudalkalibacillus berkeleyi TaxID=1069813 RepID=A0ABS9H2E3_9BACL|nr:diacylglycerol kinase family protein [Pseudalkalibacillus berkeleyi]MCF6137963.1 diacylglycerol kinase family protein [Pseudalkalibacillus berkeleyi]